MEQQQRLWSAEGTATHLPPPAQHDSGPWERSGQASGRVRAPAGRRRAGREPGLLNAHHIRGEALGRGGKRRVRPQQRAAAPARARRPCPLVNCAAQRPPASVRLPLHLRRVRPADGARAVCLWATRDGESEQHHRHSLDPPRTTSKAGTTAQERLIQPCMLLGHSSQCMQATEATQKAAPYTHSTPRSHPVPPTAGTGSTFNHLSTHLAWNSWLQGRTRRSCRASKSLKHTTHLEEAAISTTLLPDMAPDPCQAPPVHPEPTHRVCSDWWLSGLKR